MSELERVHLTQTRHLWQRKRGHRTGTDDILCAWAARSAAPPHAERALELGAGQGAVSLILADQLPQTHITAIEAQVVSYELLERNIRENALEDRYELHCGDLRRVSLEPNAFDLAFGTPPFMPMGSGTLPKDAQRAAARFEMRGGIEAYCEATARALRNGGGCAIVMDAARPDRYEQALRDTGLSIERVTSVVPMEGSEPTYLVYEAKKGAPESATIARSSFAIRASSDRLSEAYKAIRVSLNLPTSRQVWL